MKKIFTFICLLTALISEAQTLPTPPPGFTRISAKYLWLGVYPPDTTFSKYGLGAIGDSVYWGNGTRWLNVSRGTAVNVLGIQSIQKIGSSFLLVGDSTFISTDVPYLYGWNHESGRLQYNKSFKTSITDFQDGDDTYFIDSITIGNRHPTNTACNNASNIGLSYAGSRTYNYTSGFFTVNCHQNTIANGGSLIINDFAGTPGQFRNDEIVLTDGVGIEVLEGDYSDDQVGGTVPLNPATQILLSTITINSDNEIVGVSSTTVYYDNNGGEWTHTLLGTPTIDFASTINPLSPSSKHIHITVLPNNAGFRFAPGGTLSSTGKTLTFYIRHNATVANTRNWVIRKMNGVAQVNGSSAVTLTTAKGFNKTAPYNNLWQLISIKLDDAVSGFGGQDAYTGFEFRNTGTGGTVLQDFDSIRVEAGLVIAPPPSTGTIPQTVFATVDQLRASSTYLDGTTYVRTIDYRTLNDGGGAEYYYSITSNVADNGGDVIKPTGVPTGSPGRWLMAIKNHTVNVKQFGAYGDGIHDDRVAILAAYNALPLVNIAFNQQTKGNLDFPQPDSVYYVSDSILFQYHINVRGYNKANFPFATVKINVAAGKSGIRFQMGNPSGGSRNPMMENIAVFGLGTSEDTTKHGVYANTAVDFDNVHAENFGGTGITINTTVSGNANVFHLKNAGAQQNGLDGIRIDGGESNAGIIINANSQFNGRSNIHDNGFLGTVGIAGHTSGAGMRSGHTSDAIVSRSGRYYVCKKYHINKEPTVAGDWQDYWEDVGTTIEIPGSVAAWNSGTTYHEAANLNLSGAAQGGTWTGLYCEGGSGSNLIGGSNMVLGGILATGFNKNGPALVNYLGYFSAGSGEGFLARHKTTPYVYAALNTLDGSFSIGDNSLPDGSEAGKIQFIYKATDSAGGFVTANNGVFKFLFPGRDLRGSLLGLTGSHKMENGMPTFTKRGFLAVKTTESASLAAVNTNGIGRIMFGDSPPLNEGLWFAPGNFVINTSMHLNDTLLWVCNTETQGGNPAHWTAILKPAGGGISDGDKGDITVSSTGSVWTIDNSTITISKISATGTPSSSTFLRGDGNWAAPAGSGNISGTLTSGRIPVASGSGTITDYAGLTYDGTNKIGIGSGFIRDNGSAMRLIPSGDLDMFNGTNVSFYMYNSAGADGLQLYTFDRSLNSIGGTTDIKLQNANAAGKVGVGGAPDASAKLDVQSTTLGFLPPRMTTSQRNAISSPVAGLTIYCTDCTASDASTGVTQTYNGSTWKNYW